jgi:hypothetical protein
MTSDQQPSEPVHVIHRQGVTFGDRRRWEEVVATADSFGRPCTVGADTLASLAGPGFDENSGRDMAVVLGACRQLTDRGHTVLLAHHPSKYGQGTGGIRMRGHTALWGEVDAVLEFTRPDRAEPVAVVRMEPKDADLRIVRLRWDPVTFHLAAEEGLSRLTVTTLAATIEALHAGEPVRTEAIRAQFPGYGRTVFNERLSEAVEAALVRRSGRGKATGYTPATADDRDTERWT